MKKINLAFAVVAALALSACSTTVGLIPADDLYPQALTTCAPEPAVPARPADGKPRSDAAKAGYVKNLHSAYEDCHDTVDSWGERRTLYSKQFDQANSKGFFTRAWDTITFQNSGTSSSQ